MQKALAAHNDGFSPEDLLCLYLLSGGVPRFIALLMDAGATTRTAMLEYATSVASSFITEGKDILVSEFGRDYAAHFSILELIAAHKTSLSEIDSGLQRSSAPYLTVLEQEYSLVQRRKPLFSKPGARNTRWRIIDSCLAFWFRFIHANQAFVELQRFDLIRETVLRDYQRYCGLIPEDYVRAKLMEAGRFTQVGGYWDRKGENGIDLIAISDLDKTALVAEVKRNPAHIDLAVLRAKAATLANNLAPYAVTHAAFSLKDM